MPCPLTSAHKWFGIWESSKGVVSSTDGRDQMRATCEGSTVMETGASLTSAQASALISEVQQLRQQVSELKEALEDSREAVKELLISASRAPHSACRVAASAQGSPPTVTSASASVPFRDCSQHLQGACYVVRTSEELTDALRGHGSENSSRTVLLDGKLFILNPYAPVVVDRARVTIIGNNATIIGQIAVRGRGALLSVSDAFFLEPGGMQLRSGTRGDGDGVDAAAVVAEAVAPLVMNPTEGKTKKNDAAAGLMPVVSATVGASLHLNRCTLSSGRDGVYLGMGSNCTLNHVRIVNCIRGLYEGVGCRALMSACTFQSNRYHIVLLGPDESERSSCMFHGAPGADAAAAAAAATASSSSVTDAVGAASSVTFTSAASTADVLARGITNDGPIVIQQTKAQVVLQHCPITDTYEDCWCDGVRVELSEQDATAGLSDPLF